MCDCDFRLCAREGSLVAVRSPPPPPPPPPPRPLALFLLLVFFFFVFLFFFFSLRGLLRLAPADAGVAPVSHQSVSPSVAARKRHSSNSPSLQLR